jgi:hypothetical protein
MEIELFIALLVVVLAGQPAALTPLNAATLSVFATTDPGGSGPGRDGNRGCATEYLWHDRFCGLRRDAQRPGMVVRRVIAMSSGLNHAIVEGLANGGGSADLRAAGSFGHHRGSSP